jgi:hypothetical protein
MSKSLAFGPAMQRAYFPDVCVQVNLCAVVEGCEKIKMAAVSVSGAMFNAGNICEVAARNRRAHIGRLQRRDKSSAI